MLKIQREMKHGLCSKDIARQTLKQTIMLQCDKYSLECRSSCCPWRVLGSPEAAWRRWPLSWFLADD
jgi:hypothetical protein